jgi:hypothetical protein
MMVRRSLLALPVLVLSGCVDSASITAPDGPMMDVTPMSFTHVVENLLDDLDPGSLRHAISVAGNGHNITFAPELAGGTIVLAGTELLLDKSLTIVGPPGGITISGDKVTRVFRIGSVYEVVLDNLTIRDGYADPGATVAPVGGGILNLGGNLIIRNSTLEGNWSFNLGGAIEQNHGSLTIRNSTIANNGVNVLTNGITSFGGAIRTFRGVVDITNSTISGNSAANAGGGIFNNQGTLSITHGTVADNGAGAGGGIANQGSFEVPAVATLVNTIVAGNYASSSANGPDIRNVLTYVELTASHSLIGTADGHDLTAAGDNYVGVDAQFVLDGFGKPLLADNGGTTQTHMLLPGSPAIDQADGTVCAAAPVNGLDQRGVARPQGAGCDMGAVEVQGAVAPPPTTVSDVTINATGTVDKNTGVAYVTGMLTCPDPGVVNLLVSVNQEQKQRRLTLDIAGSTTVSVQCDGATAWAVAVAADNGAFVNGNVQVAAATQNIAPAAAAAEQVRLFWSK